MRKIAVTKYYKEPKHQRSCDMQTLIIQTVISEVVRACIVLAIAAFANWRSKVTTEGKEGEAQ